MLSSLKNNIQEFCIVLKTLEHSPTDRECLDFTLHMFMLLYYILEIFRACLDAFLCNLFEGNCFSRGLD